jgi:hypothetical protein
VRFRGSLGNYSDRRRVKWALRSFRSWRLCRAPRILASAVGSDARPDNSLNWTRIMAIEEPKFILSLKDADFELRDYAPSIVAEVNVSGDQDEAGRKGFRLLAGYIFGSNAMAEKIAMTAPVTKIPKGQTIAMTAPVTQIAGSGDWLVRFTMPGRYALADLPAPNDRAVTLRALPGARFAVLRFSGLAGEAKVADMTTRLMSAIKARGLEPVGPSSIARYNPPWTPWFLRRNEVMVPVKGA